MTSSTDVNFSDLGLSAPVLEAIVKIGYEKPSPIQAESIPHLLAGNDLLGTAQTGTGKTAAFALPLLSRIDARARQVQVLVLTPTRELAIQVAEAFQTYASQVGGFQVLPIYGGQSMSVQLKQLSRNPQVIVGTPGRVMDHLRRKSLRIDQLQTVVLDEADEMLRMGFIDDVTWILDQTPEQRQVALFSATMPKEIRRVADNYLREPKVVKIESKTTTVERIEQRYWTVSGTNKLDALTRILEIEETDGVIIFVRTKTQTVELADRLEARGHSAAAINGDMTQVLRERTIEHLKNGKVDIVVATDVAARGIDVTRISHVINYDIPYDTEAYVHRIGRTGRAGRSGIAILFVSPRESRLLRAIEKATRQRIEPMELPTREAVNEKRIDQFKLQINEAMERPDLEFFANLVNSYFEQDTDPRRLAAALAYLAQKDSPLIAKKETNPRREERSSGSERRDRPERSGRGDRPERGDRANRKPRASKDNDIDMETFRIELGKNQEIRPSDIVGAIANEADIDSAYIGRIELHDDYSTVDLPSGMPEELYHHLQKIKVRNKPMQLARADGGADQADKNKGYAGKARSGKPTRGKPPQRKTAGGKPDAVRAHVSKSSSGKAKTHAPGRKPRKGPSNAGH